MIVTSTETKKWQVKENTNAFCAGAVKISLGADRQTVRGFGGCFSELAYIAAGKLNENDRKEVMDSLFSKDGCNFFFSRIPVGANDFAASWYSCDETDGDYEMKHFTLERDEKYIIPFIREAMSRRPDMTFFASPWSPPTWMKFPAVYNYGRLIDTDENLRAYALYFKKFIKGYAAHGIPIVQLHVQNEPMSTQKFPSCEWTGELFRKFIADYLSKELRGVADIFFGTINGPEVDNRALISRYSDYAGYILQDKKCREAVKGIGYQWAGKYALQQTLDDYPDMEIICTESECGCGDNSYEYMMYIFEMMRHYFRNGTTAYTYWNMILDESAMSSWGWLQNSMISIINGKPRYNHEFFLMKHFAHFVEIGAVVLGISGEWSSNTVAFRNPDGKIVVVVGNPYKTEKNIELDGKIYKLEPRSVSTITL